MVFNSVQVLVGSLKSAQVERHQIGQITITNLLEYKNVCCSFPFHLFGPEFKS